MLFLYLVLLIKIPTCVALVLLIGTSAQQLDASFSTNATLEIFEVDFRDPSLDMKQKGTLPASNRYWRLILMYQSMKRERVFWCKKGEEEIMFTACKVIFWIN